MNTLAEAQKAFIEVDYRRRMSLIFVAQTQDEETTAMHAAHSFGFVIDRNERLTFDQFADRIARQYSMDDPRMAEVVRVLCACASRAVSAERLGTGPLTEWQSIWLKTCFKAHWRQNGFKAELPADLAFASKHHVNEFDESCEEYEREEVGQSPGHQRRVH